jgi:hypothetical protein
LMFLEHRDMQSGVNLVELNMHITDLDSGNRAISCSKNQSLHEHIILPKLRIVSTQSSTWINTKSQ